MQTPVRLNTVSGELVAPRCLKVPSRSVDIARCVGHQYTVARAQVLGRRLLVWMDGRNDSGAHLI